MPIPDQHDEQLLLQHLRAGSVDAYERIFKLHWHRLYVIARQKLQSHDEAEEVIQHLFFTLWEKREALLITNLTYYLNSAVKNRILNVIRTKITQDRYWEYYRNFIPKQEDLTESEVAFDELASAMETAVSQLPEKSKEVFRLSRMEGRSNAEIAGMLKLSEKSIEYHITKSLKTLRLHLKDFILFFLFPLFF